MRTSIPPTYRTTRYPELLYARFTTTLWRFLDASDKKPVGPHYRTKRALLADMERFAAQWGCVQPQSPDAGFTTPTRAIWTIEDVKASLPLVRVRDGDTIYTGYPAGRNKRYPTVYYGPLNARMAQNTWSWSAIVRSLNTDTALQA